MSGVMLSCGVYEKLLQQLVFIEEEKDSLIEHYLCTPSRDREECVRLLSDYIGKLDGMLRTAERSDSAEDAVPFVTIGSRVELLDFETKGSNVFRIISPLSSQVAFDDISFLSPLGKVLLLKCVSDEVAIEAPGGIFRYRIEGIRLPLGAD